MRLSGWLAPLITRKGEMLPLDRAASRISAFAYGNILVLSVVIAVGPSAIDNGNAALLVLGTTISTYLAHIFAGWLSHVVRHVSAADGGSDADAIRVEVRDAVPILSSGTLPAIFLALGAFDILGPAVAQLCAGGVIVRPSRCDRSGDRTTRFPQGLLADGRGGNRRGGAGCGGHDRQSGPHPLMTANEHNVAPVRHPAVHPGLVTTITSIVSSLGAPLVPKISTEYDIEITQAQWTLTATIADGRHRDAGPGPARWRFLATSDDSCRTSRS